MFDEPPKNLPVEPSPVAPAAGTPPAPPAPPRPMPPPASTPMRGGIMQAPTVSEPEDILSAVESAASETSQATPIQSMKQPSSNPLRKITIILAILAGILLLAAGGIYLAKRFASPAAPAPSPDATHTNPASGNAPVPATNSQSAAQDNTQQNNAQAPATAPDTNSPPVVPATPPPAVPTPTPVTGPDADGDGLSDSVETALGTDSHSADTDGDGLSDGDEVNVYHTDPLKSDTDGDGYADGAEVQNGYNPNGSGKLPAMK
jgi:hypothetical protein